MVSNSSSAAAHHHPSPVLAGTHTLAQAECLVDLISEACLAEVEENNSIMSFRLVRVLVAEVGLVSVIQRVFSRSF